jgi:hypothetical protein
VSLLANAVTIANQQLADIKNFMNTQIALTNSFLKKLEKQVLAFSHATEDENLYKFFNGKKTIETRFGASASLVNYTLT